MDASGGSRMMRERVLAVNSMALTRTYPHPVKPAHSPIVLRCPGPRLLPALATAVLLMLCHFTILPMVWGWLAWIALVPVLCLARSEARPRRVYFAAWACGFAFFGFVLQWMRVADPRM